MRGIELERRAWFSQIADGSRKRLVREGPLLLGMSIREQDLPPVSANVCQSSREMLLIDLMSHSSQVAKRLAVWSG